MEEVVILGIGDLGLVKNVILIFVMMELLTELLDCRGGISHQALIYNLTSTGSKHHNQLSRKTVLIFNPPCGDGHSWSGGALIERAGRILTQQGHNLTVAPTTGPRMAGALAREHVAQGADLIVVAGGDGTINEAAEGMVGSDVPLAILPGGTANVLAMETKLGGNLERVARRLGELKPRRISLGHLTCDGGRVSRYFLLMAGIGLDAHVVYKVRPGLKAKTGTFAYWVAGWSLLGKKLPEFDVGDRVGRGRGAPSRC